MSSLRATFSQNSVIKAPKPFNLDLFQSSIISDETTDQGRWYTLPDGTKYPSVTTVLKALNHEALEKWRERIGREEAEKKTTQGGNRGSGLHDALELYLTNGEVNASQMTTMTLKMFRQIKPHVDEKITKINGIELGMYSHTLRTAGRGDVIGDWEGVPAIMDFKSSKKLKNVKYLKNYVYQTTAYAIMMEEMHGFKAERLVLIFGHEDEVDAGIFVFPITKKLRNEVTNFFQTETSQYV